MGQNWLGGYFYLLYL